MNDFDYDCLQKKRISRGAFKKKNGSRSKSCSLRQDTMTRKELEEMNGETIVFNVNRPMTWVQFKRISDLSKKDYITGLVNSYNATAHAIAEDLFGVSYNTFRTLLADHDIHGVFHRGASMNEDDKKNWEVFLNGQGDGHVDISVNKSDTCDTSLLGASSAEKMIMGELNLMFCGKPNYEQIMNTLKLLLDSDVDYTINITCRI